MGIYVNPGNFNLVTDMNSPIFIDKSMLIAHINALVNTNGKHICITRARRFGKSMGGNMLAAYYSKGCDSSPLFVKMDIAQAASYETYLNKLNVIKFDVNPFYSSCEPHTDIVPIITQRIRQEMQLCFPHAVIGNTDPLELCIQKAFVATQTQFVIIIDEYDVLIREKAPQSVLDSYLRFLNAIFKNEDLSPAIALAYLTGILPIVRDKVQSKLNIFREYTMLDSYDLTPFFGFTPEEVQELCRLYGMDFEECRRWYDGYTISGQEIYNPNSVVNAMKARKFGSYWSQTGSFNSIVDLIKLNVAGVNDDIKTMLGGGKIMVSPQRYTNTMSDFRTKSDILTYLIHAGYLAFDEATSSCLIPNSEIAAEWVFAIEDNGDFKAVMELINGSRQLVQSTIDGDEDAVAAALNRAHEEICNSLNYNNEGTFQAVICLAYFYAKTHYTVIKELPTGKGFADIVLIPYLPDIPAIILELKRNKNTSAALMQIREKRYFASLSAYQGNLLFVGVNYDETTKKHTCAIERFMK